MIGIIFSVNIIHNNMNKIVTVTINDTVAQTSEVISVTVTNDATASQIHDFVVDHIGGRPNDRK